MKPKDYFIFLFTVVNVIIFIALVLLKFGNVTITGPLGDTFGGLLSPVIGIISAFLIYETFKAQREQLIDQKDANQIEKSSIYFSELKQLLEDTERQAQTFYFEIHTKESFNRYYGLDALNHFFAFYEPNVEGAISFSGNSLLNAINTQISDMIFVANKIAPLNNLLTIEHRSFLEKRLQSLINYQISNSERAFRIVRSHLRDIKSNSEVKDSLLDNVNTTIRLLLNYNSIMDNLEKLGYVNKSQIKQVGAVEFFGMRKVNIG